MFGVNYGSGLGPEQKDWKDFRKRREEALRKQNPRYFAGEGNAYGVGNVSAPPPYGPSAPGGFDNYGYDRDRQYAPHNAYKDYDYGGSPHFIGNGNGGGFEYMDPRLDQITPVAYPAPSIASLEAEESPIQKKRKCRDVICLLFLGSSIVLMLAVAGYAIAKGSIDRIIHQTDSSNCDLCGVKNERDPFIPDSGQDRSEFPLVIFLKRNGALDTSLHFFLPDESLDFVTQCRSKCPVEFSRIGNRCIGKDLALKTPKQTGVFASVSDFFSDVAFDFERTWREVIWMCAIALVLSLAMSVLLRLFAGVIIWVVVCGVTTAALAGTIVLWILWATRRNDPGSGKEGAWSQANVTGILTAAIAASIFTTIGLLLLIVVIKKIKLVIRLFSEAGKAIHAMPFLLIQPLWTFISLIIALACWLVVLMLIESAGDKVVVNAGETGEDELCIFKKSGFLQFSRWWNIFMMYWITQFIVGCQHYIIAGAVSIWFFTRNKNELGFPILLSVKRLLNYHLGCIAFGSLLVAIVKMIRYLLNFVQKRFGGDNCFCKGLLCVCKCCVWCLENFLIFLNRNAYIEIAIHGKGFCKSARRAFKVLVDNALTVSTINSIGDFVLFLAKLAIVAGTLLPGYYLVYQKEDLNYVAVPLVIAGICALFIGHCFISVYEMAIDTVFICFCEDCKMNDGRENKAYFMSKGLMKFIKDEEKESKKASKNKRKKPSH